MKSKRVAKDLDYVEVTRDQPEGVIEGARGTVVSVYADMCTVEFIGTDGFTIGLFEIRAKDLEVVEPAGAHATVARED